MSIIGITERYSSCSSLGTSISEKSAYVYVEETTDERNGMFDLYCVYSSDRGGFLKNEIIYNEISAIYSSQMEETNERNVHVEFFEINTTERYAYLPSYTTTEILKNPDIANVYYTERYADYEFCSAYVERMAFAPIIQYDERWCGADYRSYDEKWSERQCKFLVESGNLVERQCFFRAFNTKYSFTVNKKEQLIELTPNTDSIKYTLYDGLITILDEYINIYDIIQVPSKISSLDVYLLYKHDVIVGSEIENQWNCINLRSSTIFNLPNETVEGMKVFNGYLIFNYPVVSYTLSYQLVNELIQYPEKVSSFDENAHNIKVSNEFSESLLEGHNTFEEYIKFLDFKRRIKFSFDGKRKSLDYTYLDNLKTCVPIPLKISLDEDLYNNSLVDFIFRYNIIPFNTSKGKTVSSKVIFRML